jgi:hypothetical protein
MYALKQRAIQEGIYPKHFPIPVLAKEFYEMVRSQGRITEMPLVMRLFFKTDWLAALSSWRLGIGVMRTGRFSLKSEHIERRAELAAMLDSAGNGGVKAKEAA